MIRRIQQIKTFGVFADFRWPETLPEFKQFNLIYGWNYSGKTTLSRVLRCFELKQLHADFSSAQVQLKGHDGTIHDLAAPQTAPLFRVFNTDFIRDNLKFTEGNATPILLLSQKDISMQALLVAKKAEQEALVKKKLETEQAVEARNSTVERGLTTYARDLKNNLVVPNYDKTQFEPVVIRCQDAPSSYLLDESSLKQCLSVYRSVEKKAPLVSRVMSFSPTTGLRQKTDAILAKVVTVNALLPRLEGKPEVERWVNDGRPLHRVKTKCQFCDQPLPADLMKQLADHFSAEYDKLMEDIAAMKTELQRGVGEEVALVHKSDLYAELVEAYLGATWKLEAQMSIRRSGLERLIEALDAKKTMAFTHLPCPSVEEAVEPLLSALGSINEVIARHNARTSDFEKQREEAFSKLERHYAATFVRDHNHVEARQQIADLKITVGQQGLGLAVLDQAIRALERDLSEASKGAEHINEMLVAYFGKDDLQIVVSAEKQFQIFRRGVLARNLSEGEKTAVAFAYFITLVQDGRHPLSDTRIVIDDPVSSLDASHLFNTYALIKTKLGECRQLFISTHSFEFYNLIREWADEEEDLKKPQAAWAKWGIFHLKRTDPGKAMLEPIPPVLLKFKSEYHYLFWRLQQFDVDSDNFDALLSLPNMVRRFMEAFGGIMIPRSGGLRGKMPRLIPKEPARERVWKFMNHYSHNTTIMRSLAIPDTSECKAVVQLCLGAVREWDAEYFDDLVAAVA